MIPLHPKIIKYEILNSMAVPRYVLLWIALFFVDYYDYITSVRHIHMTNKIMFA